MWRMLGAWIQGSCVQPCDLKLEYLTAINHESSSNVHLFLISWCNFDIYKMRNNVHDKDI